jgi:hypothetical protein
MYAYTNLLFPRSKQTFFGNLLNLICNGASFNQELQMTI